MEELTLFHMADWGAKFDDSNPCYRYNLWRIWGDKPYINFLMLNPSTATEKTNDPTVDRCQKRADEWGYGGIYVTNLFALRATNPKELYEHKDPIGPLNDQAITEVAVKCSMIIAAWGKHGKHINRANDVLNNLIAQGLKHKIYCLKRNKDGTPIHPLYVLYDTEPRPLFREYFS